MELVPRVHEQTFLDPADMMVELLLVLLLRLLLLHLLLLHLQFPRALPLPLLFFFFSRNPPPDCILLPLQHSDGERAYAHCHVDLTCEHICWRSCSCSPSSSASSSIAHISVNGIQCPHTFNHKRRPAIDARPDRQVDSLLCPTVHVLQIQKLTISHTETARGQREVATSVLDGESGDIEIAYAEGAEEGACIFEGGEGEGEGEGA